ncbi:MAG: hypothetical protein H6746_01715 [Deltaproteobacteria bacterium]|nr:hypothetical protein [Deltaproteobacteria bacterium]
MVCELARERVAAGASSDDPALSAHLATCGACRALDAARGTGPAPALGADLLASLREDTRRGIEAERGPLAWLRSRTTPARAGMAMLGAALVLLGVLLLRRRVDLALYPTGRLLAELTVMALLSAAVLAATLRERLPVIRPTLLAPLLLAACLVALAVGLLPPAHLDHPASLAGTGPDLIPRAMACFGFGTALALPLLLLLAGLERDPLPYARRDALFAVFAGVSGLAALLLHCPITQGPHLLVGHAPVLLLLMLLWPLARRLSARARAR